jgi:hypothetical protein
MSNRRAQDERIEGTPDGVNAISEIVDVPDAPTIGTATAGINSASVAFTPATTGGTVSTFTAISSPGSFTGTSATSPITVSGLAAGTSYSFTVRGANSTGTGPYSSASNSVTPLDLPGSYDALADVTLSANTTSITFSGIPTGYKHLQVRMMTKSTDTGGTTDSLYFRFNNDTDSNYRSHALRGDGSAASSFDVAGATMTYGWIGNQASSGTGTTSTYGVGVMDILDHESVNKNKVVRFLGGYDSNGDGRVLIASTLWMSTTALTSITFAYLASSQNMTANTQFALYGVK